MTEMPGDELRRQVRLRLLFLRESGVDALRIPRRAGRPLRREPSEPGLLADDSGPGRALDAIRQEISTAISDQRSYQWLIVEFTADERWI